MLAANFGWPRQRRVAFFACVLLAVACSSNSDGGDGVGIVGPAGGVVEIREGELAGTAFAADAGLLPQNTALRIETATAEAIDGLVAVGPAARVTPVDAAVVGTVTLVVDAEHPIVIANDPAVDLVVVRVAADGRIEVLPPDAIDLVAGRVRASVAELGTFWVAVRPSDQPFALSEFLPMVGDYYQFGSRFFSLHGATAHPNLVAVPFDGWDLTVDQTVLRPNYPHDGLYVASATDGSLRFGGRYSVGSGFLLGNWQWLLAEPLVVPPAVVEGEEFADLGGLHTFVPFGSTTTVPASGGLRVRIGERRALTVPLGTFGDVVRVSFEVEFGGQGVRTIEFDLARGFGPIAVWEDGLPSLLTAARVGGEIY